MKIYAAEIMCGIGGATRGFLDVGIKVVRGVDFDESCRKTYEENNKPAKFLKCDIKELTSAELLDGINLARGDKFALIACAPCQPYSMAGVKNPKDSESLLSAINDLVYEIKPDFVFSENAPGFSRFYPPIYRKFLKPYREMKYHFECDVVNLRDFGVPQDRTRYLFIASKDYEIKLPERTHGEGKAPYVTVRKTIGKYPRLRAGKEDPAVPNHTCYGIEKITLERLRHTPRNGGGRKSWPSHLTLECHKNTKGHSDVYGRMRWDDVGPTLTCKCINISNGRFAHPEQNRGISVREAAALQTFRDDFIFRETKTLAARHVGNAVPPIVAFHAGRRIIEAINASMSRISESSTPILTVPLAAP